MLVAVWGNSGSVVVVAATVVEVVAIVDVVVVGTVVEVVLVEVVDPPVSPDEQATNTINKTVRLILITWEEGQCCRLIRQAAAPWQRLYFLPLPHGHGSFRPTLSEVAGLLDLAPVGLASTLCG
jgi:hypothetical protein